MESLWKFGGLGWREMLRKLWRQFWEDRVLDQSAMLSFYFLLAVFPLLLFLVAVFGLVLRSDDAVHQAIRQYFTALVPNSASGLIDTTLRQISRGSSGGTLSVSLLFSLWAASSGLVAVMDALNIAYGVKDHRPWWKQRLVALGLTAGLVVLLAGALAMIGYGDGIVRLVVGGKDDGGGSIALGWRVLEWLLLLGLVLMAFNVLYIFAPNVKHHRWHWLMPGTVLGVGLWLLVSFGFKLYLGVFNAFNVTYGSIAAVVILLLWFYLTGIAMLVGAELNSEIEKRTGRCEGARS